MRDEYLAKARSTLAATAMPDGGAYLVAHRFFSSVVERRGTL
jgi:hypothetical protein